MTTMARHCARESATFSRRTSNTNDTAPDDEDDDDCSAAAAAARRAAAHRGPLRGLVHDVDVEEGARRLLPPRLARRRRSLV